MSRYNVVTYIVIKLYIKQYINDYNTKLNGETCLNSICKTDMAKSRDSKLHHLLKNVCDVYLISIFISRNIWLKCSNHVSWAKLILHSPSNRCAKFFLLNNYIFISRSLKIHFPIISFHNQICFTSLKRSQLCFGLTLNLFPIL